MDQSERHAYGAHFTNEAEIQKVVQPTISLPWRERIARCKSLNDLIELRKALLHFRVLDPACGSGNFLYVAYRELLRIETELLVTVHERFGDRGRAKAGEFSLVRTDQFYGLDNNSFAVELAKVTLTLARQLGTVEACSVIESAQIPLPLGFEKSLPLDNLDSNIVCEDALFSVWPKADAIIGNPPYQSKNKMLGEFGAAYLNRLRDRYPSVPGKADYCVYWFRRAHDEMHSGARAGLVGTNTIRQNYSREGGLDYIVNNGGTITEAVSTQVFPGEAVVHVSIVNWVKGRQPGKKRLLFQDGDNSSSPWRVVEVSEINPALSDGVDVTRALVLAANAGASACFQGQTHGHEGFLLSPDEAKSVVNQSNKNAEVLHPFMTGDDLLGEIPPGPSRFVIDFYPLDVVAARQFKLPFDRVKSKVLPTRRKAAKAEDKRNKAARRHDPDANGNRHHEHFLNHWWWLSYPRGDLLRVLSGLPRYVVCVRVTRRPIFEFVSSKIRPNDALQVFTLADDYSFGILQSDVHWRWFVGRCSTLKADYRYTSNTVFDSFPWPQQASTVQVKAVARAGVLLRELRSQLLKKNRVGLRELYRTLDLPGANPLKEAHEELDRAVRDAYGMKETEDALSHLLALNLTLSKDEERRRTIVGPGLPSKINDLSSFITQDAVAYEVP